MQNHVMEFSFQGRPIRAINSAGEPEFVAKDVAEILGYANTRKAVIDHCKHAHPVGSNDSLPPLDPQTVVIPESDLYRLVIKSNMPAAEKFEAWVMEEVLPSIRRNGMYATPALLDDPEHLLQVTQRLVDERRARLAAEAEKQALQGKVIELAPKADFYDAVVASVNSMEVRDFAKAIGAGPNKFLDWLRKEGYLMQDRIPYQRYIDQGIFEVELRTFEQHGKPHTYPMAMVTGKGKPYLYRKWCEANGSMQLRLEA